MICKLLDPLIGGGSCVVNPKEIASLYSCLFFTAIQGGYYTLNCLIVILEHGRLLPRWQFVSGQLHRNLSEQEKAGPFAAGEDR